MTLNNKNMLITLGFPRSGNTFLNFVLWQLYYPEEKINGFFHTTKIIEKNKKNIIPIRKPSDCISSWYNFLLEKEELSASCKYYLRFHTQAKEMNNNLIFVDFDYMIDNLDYIKKIVYDNFKIKTNSDISIEKIKDLMVDKKRDWNLPRKNQQSLEQTKNNLKSLEEFGLCEKLYFEIKAGVA